MAVVLVTGSNGQLGSELKNSSQRAFGHRFNFTDIETLDLTDPAAVEACIKATSPDWIINCAAYNFVDKAETEPEKAMLINSEAVKNISTVIRDSTVRFIHISTDFVFDGLKKAPYTETDFPKPLSAYGVSKLQGEKNALIHPGTMVIRTSWLYSAHGNNFVKTVLRLASERDSLKVVSDQKGTPTWAADLSEAIINIILSVNNHQAAFNSGIYHYSNDGECTWYEFAKAILEEAQSGTPVYEITTPEFGAPATRPAYSVLSKKKITENYGLEIPHWRVSLNKCIKALQTKR